MQSYVPTRRTRFLHKMVLLDQRILLAVRSLERDWLTPAMLTLTKLGDTSTYFAVGLVLLAVGSPLTLRCGALLGTSAIVASLIAAGIKHLFRRERPLVTLPDFSALVSIPDRYSFPSGHTATAFAVAVSLSMEGVFLGPLLLASAFGIGSSRIYLGAHYPLDVIVGAVLGSFVGLLTRFALLGLFF